ncbi:MAG: winged helix-turn-helix transcriptional regulator [Candidatus Micrarchaeota archaeon]|nr:winged helix-turn-helix transcriptional regulator [Candidatus Micrarchaeota archaeon]
MKRKINISELDLPGENENLQKKLEWLASSFGYCNRQGKSNDESKIFCEMLIDIARNGKTSTKRLAKKLNMPLQKVIYHVRTFVNQGFFYRKKRFIYLREYSLYETVSAVKDDINKILSKIERISKEVDIKLKFKK